MQSDNWRAWLPNCSSCWRDCRKIIICASETLSVSDPNFAETLLIPDAVFVQDVPENIVESNNNSNSEDFNIQEKGSWYRSPVCYEAKIVVLGGSSTLRGVIR